MSTRAVYTFTEGKDKYHVYKHHDGYPGGAARAIRKAVEHAWDLPRFEADEFAAAFVAANKTETRAGQRGGGVRLTHGPKKHGDLEFRYEITFQDELHVKCYEVGEKDRLIWSGTLDQMDAWVAKDLSLTR